MPGLQMMAADDVTPISSIVGLMDLHDCVEFSRLHAIIVLSVRLVNSVITVLF